MPLVEPEDVRNFLPGYTLSDDTLDVSMRLVASWLREDAGLTELPDALTADSPLWAPALELTALVASNPELLAQKTVGPTSRSWPIVQQRDAIRARVRANTVAAASTASPFGSFPDPYPWPDGPVFPAGGWR